MKKKLILFGSIGAAVECLEWLLGVDEIEIAGVVCTQEPRSAWREAVNDRDMKEVAPKLGIPVLTLEEVLEMEADIGISIRFHQILRQAHLDRFRLGVVNLHGAPLPEMRGAMCNVMAIIENRQEFGVSLHWMDTGIDSGDLIAVDRFRIFPEDTVYDLFKQCNEKGLALLKQHLADLVSGRLKGEAQQTIIEKTGLSVRTYRYKEAQRYKVLEPGLSETEIWNRVRAFQFPGHEPAYFMTPFGKVELNAQTVS